CLHLGISALLLGDIPRKPVSEGTQFPTRWRHKKHSQHAGHRMQTKREHRQAQALLNLKFSDILAPHALPVRFFTRILMTCTRQRPKSAYCVYTRNTVTWIKPWSQGRDRARCHRHTNRGR
ncbi:hypothetical protein PspLS_07649, partial [Pyricularia sp. CBS 133598]